LMKLKI